LYRVTPVPPQLRQAISLFPLFYLHLINGLPGAKFAQGAGQMDMAKFVFDGGEGILMPMKQ
jgi:hypothetical protein